MPNPVGVIEELFRACSRIRLRTYQSVWRSEQRSIVGSAMRSTSIEVHGVIYSYEQLSARDKEALDAVCDITCRCAQDFVAHHDEDVDYQINGTPREIWERRADRLMRAIEDHYVSAGYDHAVGKPTVVTQKYAKQYALNLLKELTATVRNNST